ncbi:MAG: polyprenyl synthetase family protein [Desulfobacteraceae bacterium]|nr:polyprenyl synthetase family protein [Desulfobacteraceae bacterium]MBU4000776.1 polyprenyl synthetase family protein [Pseudomonadota bacterium]MBU4056020.1 polyprenyl synthetase family protein [Pseudomonadota bacterium]
MTDLKTRLLEAVHEDLEQIEAALKTHLTPDLDLVSEVAGHILFSGGKRIRPLLIVLCARLCGYEGKYVHHFTTAFEYLHTATLLHDDLVDDAALRRGKPVANALWGNSVAVLVGDFLFARASGLAASTQIMEGIEIIARVTEKMTQGELFQLAKKGKLDLTEQEYMDVIQWKTGVLFQGSCEIGAGLAEAEESRKAALSDYGLNLGIAFQMADDLLDYTRNENKALGKNPGADLREGKLTLPVIHGLKNAEGKDRAFMEDMIRSKNFSLEAFHNLVDLLETNGGMAYTREKAKAYVEKAKACLDLFPDSKTREILKSFADYALFRSA